MLRDVELSAKHSWHCNQYINLVNNVAFEPLVNRGLQERTYLLLLLDIWCGVNHTHISGMVSCGDLMKFIFLKMICNQREKLGTYFGVYVSYTHIREGVMWGPYEICLSEKNL